VLLGGLIETVTKPEQRTSVGFRASELPFHHGLDADQAQTLAMTSLPLPASRTQLPEGELGLFCKDLLGRMGLEWENIRVKKLKDVFFSKGSRKATFVPTDLRHSHKPDDLYKGKQKLRLSFVLGKGSYATILVKRLSLAEHASFEEIEDETS
jgi:tRNA pseudouridine13 synthase